MTARLSDEQLAAIADLVGPDVLAQDRTALDEAHDNLARAIARLRAVDAAFPESDSVEVRWAE